MATLCAEGHSNPNLVRALNDVVSDQAIQTQTCQADSDDAKCDEECRNHAFLNERPAYQLASDIEARDGQPRILRWNQLAQDRRQCSRVAGRAHEKADAGQRPSP